MTRGPATGVQPIGVMWEGAYFVHHSFANINRELVLVLAEDPGLDLGLVPHERDQFDARSDRRLRRIAERLHVRPRVVHCHVRHQWPPDFTRPRQGALALMQPVEYGSIPVRWVRGIERGVDEVWANSTFIRDAYLRSGIDAERVAVIPLGVNPALFHPGVPPRRLRTRASFRFLFVGGSILRKGFDVLLEAYLDEFSRDDDVCLVIKDFHYGDVMRDVIRMVRRRSSAPEIRYMYGNAPYHRLGALYTACDCYVHPYRAEGFGLPMLEAMACGLPVIVTGRGAALDFCDAEVAYLVPATEVPVPDWPRGMRLVAPPVWAEPDVAALRRTMRHVFEHRDEAREMGRRARVRALRSHTWQHTAAAVRSRLERWM